MRKAKGQATVEFALILILLIFLFLVILQAGLVMQAQLVVTHASREGAREGVVSNDNGKIITAINRSASSLNKGGLSYQISSGSGRKIGSPMTVTVRYRMPLFIPFINNIVLSQSTTMRMEKE